MTDLSKRRRVFDWSDSLGRYHMSRSACHRSPKLAEGVLDCAGRAAAATALSKRSGVFDWSDPLGRTTRSKAVSRSACHRSPKLTEGVLDCAGRAPAATALSKRSGVFDWSDSLGRYHTLESGVALRLPPQSKIDRGRFGLRRQRGSGDGAFETEWCVRLVKPARSSPHARKRCRAPLATAVQN